MRRSSLNEHELRLLEAARDLEPGDPPSPWGARMVVSAAGVLAGGWDDHENVLVISSDGYSVTEPVTGRRLERDRDYKLTYASLSRTGLSFTIPTTSLTVPIFGQFGGDGIHGTQDGWELERIAPWWPHESIVIRTPDGARKTGIPRYRDGVYMIGLLRLEDFDLRCGFSPSGRHFMILGSAGAEVFSRE
jgi:hypothetical protein